MTPLDTDSPPVQAAPNIKIKDHRCRNCGRLLFRAHIPQGMAGLVIEIRCGKCTRITIIESEMIAALDTRAILT